jgi:hypothetical protein
MQMKIKLFLLLFLPKIIFGQTENLIRNEGFEYKTNDASSYEPNALSQLKFTSYWKEEIYDAGSSGQNHSPDFFSNLTSFLGFDALTGNIVFPHSGNNYIGMSQAELIQQEFSEVAELIEGKKYTISFYMQPLKNSQAGGNWSSYTLLSIMLRKKKMKYENHTNENYNEWCTDLANDHKNEDGPTYHVADIPINLSSYPLGVWTKISVDFDAPSNAEDYDYVIFETNDNLDMCDSYLCLDDFRFYQTGCAEDNCSQTSGLINALASPENHNVYTPWWVDNLDNVSHIKIEIIAQTGALVRIIEVFATNGIKNRIYWDGRNSNGDLIANAVYIFKVTMENECKTTHANIPVFVDDESYTDPDLTNPFIIPPFINDNSGYKIPKECCVSDIYIDNVSIGGIMEKRFVASHSVNVATLPSSWVTLTQDADVLFKAGSFVEIGPGFNPDNGKYTVEIEPCPGRYSDPEEIENNLQFSNYTGKLLNTEKDFEPIDQTTSNEIKYYPNPTNHQLLFELETNEKYAVSVFDGMGNFVKGQIISAQTNYIDCSNLSNGIYFILLSNENKKLKAKFIKN